MANLAMSDRFFLRKYIFICIWSVSIAGRPAAATINVPQNTFLTTLAMGMEELGLVQLRFDAWRCNGITGVQSVAAWSLFGFSSRRRRTNQSTEELTWIFPYMLYARSHNASCCYFRLYKDGIQTKPVLINSFVKDLGNLPLRLLSPYMTCQFFHFWQFRERGQCPG